MRFFSKHRSTEEVCPHCGGSVFGNGVRKVRLTDVPLLPGVATIFTVLRILVILLWYNTFWFEKLFSLAYFSRYDHKSLSAKYSRLFLYYKNILITIKITEIHKNEPR